MEKLILVFHVLTALAIIGLILLQQGKGAEAGASFGAGASQTVFGSQGGGNFFTRATSVLAALFFATSFGLAIVAKQQSEISTDAGIPVAVEQADIPALVEEQASDLPVVEEAADTAGDIPMAEEPSSAQ